MQQQEINASTCEPSGPTNEVEDFGLVTFYPADKQQNFFSLSPSESPNNRQQDLIDKERKKEKISQLLSKGSELIYKNPQQFPSLQVEDSFFDSKVFNGTQKQKPKIKRAQVRRGNNQRQVFSENQSPRSSQKPNFSQIVQQEELLRAGGRESVLSENHLDKRAKPKLKAVLHNQSPQQQSPKQQKLKGQDFVMQVQKNAQNKEIITIKRNQLRLKQSINKNNISNIIQNSIEQRDTKAPKMQLFKSPKNSVLEPVSSPHDLNNSNFLGDLDFQKENIIRRRPIEKTDFMRESGRQVFSQERNSEMQQKKKYFQDAPPDILNQSNQEAFFPESKRFEKSQIQIKPDFANGVSQYKLQNLRESFKNARQNYNNLNSKNSQQQSEKVNASNPLRDSKSKDQLAQQQEKRQNKFTASPQNFRVQSQYLNNDAPEPLDMIQQENMRRQQRMLADNFQSPTNKRSLSQNQQPVFQQVRMKGVPPQTAAMHFKNPNLRQEEMKLANSAVDFENQSFQNSSKMKRRQKIEVCLSPKLPECFQQQTKSRFYTNKRGSIPKELYMS